ncbi:MAG: radical SAM protein [Bacillota bacterium]|nr:radical SAM protein [Bacillota bacterium]
MSKSHYIIPIFVPHEGCPHNCVFCNQTTITGNSNKVDSSYVREIVEQYLTTINSKDSTIEISFFGGTFTAIRIEKQNELLEVAKEYKDNGLINFIRLSTRPDYINNTILDNLKRFSVDIIELGIQSLDEEVLKKSGRGHSYEDVKYASELILKYGFAMGHQIMLGLPGDNFDKDILTVKKIIELKPHICRIYPSLVIKNTPMEDMYLKGTYKPYTLEEAIYISKIIYGMLIAHDINVIRIGLQPTEEINVGGELVDGPFHPAFRELVEGSIICEAILNNIPEGYKRNLLIQINNKDLSKLYANKKVFFNDMIRQCNGVNIKVEQNPSLDRGVLKLVTEDNERTLSVNEYIKSNYGEGNKK